MDEERRVYCVGDSVISKYCLDGRPVEPPALRAQIPRATRGTVVDVRPYVYPKPYSVLFDTDDGYIEVDVAEQQIGLVKSAVAPAGVPPLHVSEPDRRINRRALHVPTMSHPHYDCKRWHRTHRWLFCVGYGLVLERYTIVVGVITLVILLGAYSNHLMTSDTWTWVPRMFRPLRPEEDEKEVAEPHYIMRARRWDVIFTGVFSVFLVYCIETEIGAIPLNEILRISLAGVALVAWLTKFVMHDRAVRIYPDYDCE